MIQLSIFFQYSLLLIPKQKCLAGASWICHDNDNDNESNCIAMNDMNHITHNIQARLIEEN